MDNFVPPGNRLHQNFVAKSSSSSLVTRHTHYSWHLAALHLRSCSVVLVASPTLMLASVSIGILLICSNNWPIDIKVGLAFFFYSVSLGLEARLVSSRIECGTTFSFTPEGLTLKSL